MILSKPSESRLGTSDMAVTSGWKARQMHQKKPIAQLVGFMYPKPYLEGQGDLVSRLITPRNHIVTLIIPIPL